MIRPTYKAEFDIVADNINGLENTVVGQKVKGMIVYEVIEKTKSYVVLLVNGYHSITSARKL
jgi:hypothetical protein